MAKKKSAPELNKEQWKARLVAMREDLSQLIALHHEPHAAPELDQTTVGRVSRADAIQEHEMASATQRRRQQEIAKIDAALNRLEEGEFGFCVTCGARISDGRLELDPTTPFCVKHAK